MATTHNVLPAESATAPDRDPGATGGRGWKRLVTALLVLGGLALTGLLGVRVYRSFATAKSGQVPTAKVRRGDVTLAITARGELRGGNPQMLTAPMTGGMEMHIVQLRKTGEEVKPGDVVVQLDTAEQQFKLQEAEADLAEAAQNLIKARAQREAEKEEDHYALLKAKTDVALAELDVRKNPLLAAIAAKENDLALEGARDHLKQTEQNLNNRKATGEAGLAIQDAARAKAEAQATTARQNIEAMTLRADRAGYVAVQVNSSTNFFFPGMVLPFFQVGDTARPGMAIAQIPDLKNWEVVANIGELDRGHLRPGQKVAIAIIAVPDRQFSGAVKGMGGMTGPIWDRRFECKISLENPVATLRPGMSATVTVTTDQLRQVLSLPAQALFESDGRTFVYVRSGDTFVPKDVELVQRNETRAVVDGLKEGEMVALANPLEISKSKQGEASPLKSVGK
jgi:multidrug efflux pump subunit AcrA (membrane-fusion protein)